MPMEISTVQEKFRDDFAATEQNAMWKVVQVGDGMTVDWAAASALRILTGVTPNAETVIRSTRGWRSPFRVMFYALLTSLISQRIANQEIELRVVSEDGKDYAGWAFDGTSLTTGKIRSANGGIAAPDATVTGLPDVNSGSPVFEIETFIDEVYWHARTADSTTGRVASQVRNRKVPDPWAVLFIEIRVRNLATAPASNTTLALDAITVQDITELTAEITGGRGGGGASQAVPVAISGVPTVNTAGNAVAPQASVSAASPTITRYQALTSADQQIKTTAAKLYWLYAFNPGAADAWVHIYSGLIAAVAPGTTVPMVSMRVPAGQHAELQMSAVPYLTSGTGMAIAATTSQDSAIATTPATPIFAEVGWL